MLIFTMHKNLKFIIYVRSQGFSTYNFLLVTPSLVDAKKDTPFTLSRRTKEINDPLMSRCDRDKSY